MSFKKKIYETLFLILFSRIYSGICTTMVAGGGRFPWVCQWLSTKVWV